MTIWSMNARVSWTMSALTWLNDGMFGFWRDGAALYPMYCSKKCCSASLPAGVPIIARACAATSPRLPDSAVEISASLGADAV